jgi:choline dehydrogenase-like flavoprotein
MDARSAGIEPALKTGHAAILDRCHVDKLSTSGNAVSRVVATRGGERLTFRARYVVSAAGGLGSPRLLLASAGENWPRGLANGSGLVGRNLMFHLSELFALWSARNADRKGPSRTIALRDFYFRDGQRFGIVQSMGMEANYGNIVQVLNERFDRSPLRSARYLREFLRVPALAASWMLGDAKIFVAILEDLPNPENRVEFKEDDPYRMVVTYKIPAELHARRRALRRTLRKSLPGAAKLFLQEAPIVNFAHPSGTLRFGTDPKSSVLDENCRTHAVANLFVADSSFMPTSTGVNPSLTIAANALRVADVIVEELARHDVARETGICA